MVLNRELGIACRYGNLEEVKNLVKRGAGFKFPGEPANKSAARIERGSGSDFSLMLMLFDK